MLEDPKELEDENAIRRRQERSWNNNKALFPRTPDSDKEVYYRGFWSGFHQALREYGTHEARLVTARRLQSRSGGHRNRLADIWSVEASELKTTRQKAYDALKAHEDAMSAYDGVDIPEATHNAVNALRDILKETE